jgi:hypothetical protein
MKLAIISDLHALREALEQIERLDCEQIVCAGDILDGGLFPEETIRVLRERRIPTIRGNHDRWAIREGRHNSGGDLTAAAVTFLEGLPTSWTRTIDEVRVAVWHAWPGSDMNGIYPDASTTELGRSSTEPSATSSSSDTRTWPSRGSSAAGSCAIPARSQWTARCCSTARAAGSRHLQRPAAGPSAYWSCRRYSSPSAGRGTATRSRARDKARTRPAVRCLSGATSHAERTVGGLGGRPAAKFRNCLAKRRPPIRTTLPRAPAFTRRLYISRRRRGPAGHPANCRSTGGARARVEGDRPEH